ncbi:MAG: P1 family peptidase [Betaproteobacteria bacterium]
MRVGSLTDAAGLKVGGLTDVPGLKVGHYTDPRRPTGCTVVLCEDGAVCGVDVRGGAPGTRETDLLKSENTVEHVHAVLLTGGSAFGLAAATGVVEWLEERGHGLQVGPARVPLVPTAVLFDLWVGDQKIRPDAQAGRAACDAATTGAVAQGNVGAGTGTAVGKLFGIRRAMKGGIGTASVRLGGFTVAALVAVNAVGDVLGEDGQVLAGARSEDGLRLVGTAAATMRGEGPQRLVPGSATTIGLVATDATLTKAQANKLASLAHHGLSRAIDPITTHDGDTLFALATGRAGRVDDLSGLGAVAAELVARAIRRAVRAAEGLPAYGLLAVRDLPGQPASG